VDKGGDRHKKRAHARRNWQKKDLRRVHCSERRAEERFVGNSWGRDRGVYREGET